MCDSEAQFHGDEDIYAAHHVGREAPFGIRIMAREPQVVGPLQRPHRCIIQDGNRYLGWTDNEFHESSDGMTWTKKANLIELPNGDWALPYSAHNVPHKYPRGQRKGGLGYAVWSKGRMVALEADTLSDATRPRSTLAPTLPLRGVPPA